MERAPSWLLPLLMGVGAALGLLLGVTGPLPGVTGVVVQAVGAVFLALLRALVIPLVVTSLMVAVARMGDLRRVGRAAAVTLGFFAVTTFAAVATGLVLVNAIRPGTGQGSLPVQALGEAQLARASTPPSEAILEVVTGMFPDNLLEAAADGNVLGLVVFSLLFGLVLTVEGDRARPLLDVLDAANEALLRLVRWVVWAAPVGILALVAERTARAGGGAAVAAELQRLSWYAATVVAGLALHALVTLPIALIASGRNPLRYGGRLGGALLTAFGTASSAATMPVTLRGVIEGNGVSRRAADLVIPLGTTVNMNGTALYEAVAALFIAQASGIDLGPAQQMVVLLTATLAAVGAAAIPEAGLVTMVLVLTAAGLPVEGIGLILSIDWVLDRFRTVVNVWGDAVGAAVVERLS